MIGFLRTRLPNTFTFTSGMQKLKRLTQNIALLLATLLVMVLAGEVAVRLFSQVSAPLIKHDEILGRTFRENTARKIRGPESGQTVLIRINEKGFRTPSRPFAKQPGAIRLALIGDSQIAAINTPEEHTMAALLEQRLNSQYPQARWEVFNFGVSGANTAQEFHLYKELVRRYNVDLVVCAYYNGNDFSDNSPRLSRSNRLYMDLHGETGELVTLYPAPSRNKLSNWLNENSRLYVWQKYVTGDAVNNFRAMGGAGNDLKMREEFLIFVDDPLDEVLEYSWRINETIIRDFNETVLADKGLFLFLSIPHGIETTQWQWEELRNMAAGTGFESKILRANPEKRLGGIMAKHGIDSLFLKSVFTEHLQTTEPGAPGHFLAYREGRGHLNETGNAVMTDALLKHLAEKGSIARLLERATGPGQKRIGML